MRDDCTMATGFSETVVRPRGGQVLTVAVAAGCCIPVVGLVSSGDLALLLRLMPVIALVAFGATALFWLPAVRIDPAAVEVRNVLRTTRVTWPAIEDVETRWSLVLVTGSRRVTAWAAPHGSAVAEARSVRREFRAARVGANPSSAAGRTPGSLAATLVVQQWHRYRDGGLLGAVEGAGVTTRWHRGTITALAVLAVLTALGVVL